MIRIQIFLPAAKYDLSVRVPGLIFLAGTPNPTAREWNQHNYWRLVHDDLFALYDGICAYCASWMPRRGSDEQMKSTIDHFIPKTVDKSGAYEWNNFRICRRRMNMNKDVSMDVVDPAKIQNGWFQIDFSTFQIKSDPNLAEPHKTRVDDSIRILDLNNNDYVEERIAVIQDYCLEQIPYLLVTRRFPFIASEMARVSFDKVLKDPMRTRFEKLNMKGAQFGP